MRRAPRPRSRAASSPDHNRSAAEDRGPDPDVRRATLDRDLVVAAHPHRQHGEGLAERVRDPIAELAQRGEHRPACLRVVAGGGGGGKGGGGGGVGGRGTARGGGGGG